MGEIRKLSNNELDTRIKELSKEEVDFHKNPEEIGFYRGEGADNLRRALRESVQSDYETGLWIHKNELRALQTEDLINYLEQVLEQGLLKPNSFLEASWEWEEPESDGSRAWAGGDRDVSTVPSTTVY